MSFVAKCIVGTIVVMLTLVFVPMCAVATCTMAGTAGTVAALTAAIEEQDEPATADTEARQILKPEPKRENQKARRAAALKRRDERRDAQERRALQRKRTSDARGLLDDYVTILSGARPGVVQNVSVKAQGDEMWVATLTIADSWHVRHYQIRLQDAQMLWRYWALIASPDAPDKAYIEIDDRLGNSVGGSRMWGGSMIWVRED